jgi:hypothetical protein
MAGAIIDSWVVALTPAEELVHSELSSDLAFVLNESLIPIRLQFEMARRHFRNLALFAAMADTRTEVRGIMASDFGVDLTVATLTDLQKIAGRQAVTATVAAWGTVNSRVTEVAKLAAESAASRLPLMLPIGGMIALRKRYEALHGKVPDHTWPCYALIEKRLEEIEQGSLSATPLSEVISIEAANDEIVTIPDTGIRVRKSPKAILPPASTEEFRDRIKTLAISFEVAGFKHSHKPWLRSANMACFDRFVSYILGAKIAGRSLDGQGLGVKADWNTVLAYELAIRKHAVDSILYEGKTFDDAMTAGCKDLEIKEQYFITPTAILNSNRRTPDGPPKGPGKGRAAKGQLANNAPAIHGEWGQGMSIKAVAKRKLREAAELGSHAPAYKQGKTADKGKGKSKGKHGYKSKASKETQNDAALASALHEALAEEHHQ